MNLEQSLDYVRKYFQKRETFRLIIYAPPVRLSLTFRLNLSFRFSDPMMKSNKNDDNVFVDEFNS